MVPLAAVRNERSDQSSTAEKPIRVAIERDREVDMPPVLACGDPAHNVSQI
jgi:hypothetical protein